MNTNDRFGQIEMMLAEMLRRMDRQSEQFDDVINILKISDARQTRAEERMERVEVRQDAMLTEIKEQGQRLAEQGQRLAEQGQRLAEQGQRLEEQGQRLEKQGQRLEKHSQQIDTMLQTQMQMLALMSHDAKRTDALEYESKTFASYESRFQRLEEVVFKQTS